MGIAKQMLFEEMEREERRRAREERELIRWQRSLGVPKDECLDLERPGEGWNTRLRKMIEAR
jgi:hypothetical protein